MPSSMDSYERQVAMTLDLSNLPSITLKIQIAEINLIVVLLPRPIECFGPCMISKPVANEIRVTLSYS